MGLRRREFYGGMQVAGSSTKYTFNPVSSTGRRNTLAAPLSRCFIFEGISGTLVNAVNLHELIFEGNSTNLHQFQHLMLHHL